MRARDTADGGKLVGYQCALDGERRDTQDARGSGRTVGGGGGVGVGGFWGINSAEVPRAGGDARGLELLREKTRNFRHRGRKWNGGARAPGGWG